MLQSNIINNINIDTLPESVQEAIICEFKILSIQEKLIVYSRLIHGNLFKSARTDLFKVNKVSVAQVYDKFIQNLKLRLDTDNEFEINTTE